MDPKLIDLLVSLNLIDAAQAAALTDLATLGADDLVALQTGLVDLLGRIERTNPTDDDLQVAVAASGAHRAVTDEFGRRRGDDDRRAETVSALIAAALGADDTPPAPATSTATATRVPSITQLSSRTPPRSRPLLRRANAPEVLTAAGVPAQPGETLADVVTAALNLALRDARPADAAREEVVLATVRAAYPDERTLGADPHVNNARINVVASPEALAASGGICGPTPADYTVDGIGSADRPVRDALMVFGAPRGGVRFVLPHTLAQVTVDGPAGVWTAATDLNPGGATKPHAVYTCASVQEATVDAIPAIVQFGNFQARYFPEQIDEYMQTVDAVHARLAEATLLAAMTAGSTAVSGGVTLIGSTPEFLATIDRAASAYRYRHRMKAEAPLQLIYPEWLEDNFRADLARELPGNSGGQSERLAVADAQIDQFFRARNIIASTTLDSPTGATPLQGWGAQAAGPLLGWPTKATAWLFHPGAWMFLDGGALNLGIVRDATLNAGNNLQMFSETFEKAVFRGHESLAITTTIADTGMRAGTVDTSALVAAGS